MHSASVSSASGLQKDSRTSLFGQSTMYSLTFPASQSPPPATPPAPARPPPRPSPVTGRSCLTRARALPAQHQHVPGGLGGAAGAACRLGARSADSVCRTDAQLQPGPCDQGAQGLLKGGPQALQGARPGPHLPARPPGLHQRPAVQRPVLRGHPQQAGQVQRQPQLRAAAAAHRHPLCLSSLRGEEQA